MTARVDRDGWQFMEKRGEYAEWIKSYSNGRVGNILCWPDGDVTFTLAGNSPDEARIGGRCSSLEDAQVECDRRWKLGQN